MINEECWLLFGKQIGKFWFGRKVAESYHQGSPTLVRFSPQFALDNAYRLVGFFHTHPSFTADYSQTDDTTMKGWQVTTGKNLACVIKGVDRLAVHWYNEAVWEGQAVKETKCWQIGNFFFGRIG